jgi:hypothetical protein
MQYSVNLIRIFRVNGDPKPETDSFRYYGCCKFSDAVKFWKPSGKFFECNIVSFWLGVASVYERCPPPSRRASAVAHPWVAID